MQELACAGHGTRLERCKHAERSNLYGICLKIGCETYILAADSRGRNGGFLFLGTCTQQAVRRAN